MDGKIYLIRHAKATHNRYDGKAVFAGGRVDSDLTAEGESEAREMGCFFKDKDIKVIVHSPLKRSKHTAQIIKSEISDKADIEMVELKGIEEVDVGEFTGKEWPELEKNYPKQLKSFSKGDVNNFDFPNGENYLQIKERVIKSLNIIDTMKKDYENIVVVGHGMFNRVMLSVIYPKKPELWEPIGYPHDKIITINLPQRLLK